MRLHHDAFDMPLDQVVISHTDRWLRSGCTRKVSAEAIEHERLDLGGGEPGDAAGAAVSSTRSSQSLYNSRLGLHLPFSAPCQRVTRTPSCFTASTAGIVSLSPVNSATDVIFPLPASKAMSTPSIRSTRFCWNSLFPSLSTPTRAS